MKKLDARVVKLDSLRQDPENANRGTDEGAGILNRSLQEFGFIDAGLIGGDDIIIGGNKRQLAASANDISHAIVIDITDLPKDHSIWLQRKDLNLSDPADKRAARAGILLNRASQANLVWDEKTIAVLAGKGIPLEDVFEGDPKLSRLLRAPEEEEVEEEPEKEYEEIEDPADEAQAEFNVKEGDLWRIGPHAVICGDCTDPDTYKRLLSLVSENKLSGCITSPPYAEQRANQYGGIPEKEYLNWFSDVQSLILGHMAPHGSFFLNIKEHMSGGGRSLYVKRLTIKMVDDWGWHFVDEFCWVKAATPGHYHYSFKNGWEPIFQFVVTPKKFKFRPNSVKAESQHVPQGERRPGDWRDWVGKAQNMGVHGEKELLPGFALPSNVLRGHKNDKTRGHSAAFPTQIPSFFMKAYSDPGDIWLDPFVGSGTSVLSAHATGRIGLGIELLPKHVAIVLKRMVEEAGLTPEKIE